MKKTFLLVAAICLLLSCNQAKSDKPSAGADKEDHVSQLVDLSAETNINKLLCQNWENKEDAEDLAATGGGGGGLQQPFRGLSFFEDGGLLENPRDNIRFGAWRLDDATKLIHVRFNNGSKADYKIAAIGAKQMVLMDMEDKKKTTYRSDAAVEKLPADDPFYPSNNFWRIKPAHKESDSAIKNRVEQCAIFYAKFLRDNVDRSGGTISFYGLPSCFKWYRGGISVVRQEKLEEQWINCFYNKEQALQAQAMVEKVISKKYKWNKDESNWVKQSADVMKQMCDTIKAL